MPRTRTQRIVFSILMAFAMVYGMELYNQALLAGGLRTELFAAPLADIVPLMAAVIALETLVGGRVVARLVATLAFRQPPAGELVATWLQTVELNFPMALLWQLFVAGPAVRAVVRTMGAAPLAFKQPRALTLSLFDASRTW